VLGSVNVTGPAERLPDSEVPEVASEVIGAARWIEQQLVTTPGSLDSAPRPSH
jgi:hypothetical protein